MCYNMQVVGALAQLGAHNTGSVGVRGSNPLRSTSGKLPPPIIGDVQRYAKLHTTMMWFGFKSECSTNNKGSRHSLDPLLLVVCSGEPCFAQKKGKTFAPKRRKAAPSGGEDDRGLGYESPTEKNTSLS